MGGRPGEEKAKRERTRVHSRAAGGGDAAKRRIRMRIRQRRHHLELHAYRLDTRRTRGACGSRTVAMVDSTPNSKPTPGPCTRLTHTATSHVHWLARWVPHLQARVHVARVPHIPEAFTTREGFALRPVQPALPLTVQFDEKRSEVRSRFGRGHSGMPAHARYLPSAVQSTVSLLLQTFRQ